MIPTVTACHSDPKALYRAFHFCLLEVMWAAYKRRYARESKFNKRARNLSEQWESASFTAPMTPTDENPVLVQSRSVIDYFRLCWLITRWLSDVRNSSVNE